MNLDSEEAERIFPRDRGFDIDDVDLEHDMTVERCGDGSVRVTVGEETRTLDPELLGLESVWELFVERGTMRKS